MNANTTLSHAASRNTARRTRPAFFAVIDILAGATMAAVRWWQMQQDERLLLSQPDHLLRDLGIERKDVRTILRHGMPR